MGGNLISCRITEDNDFSVCESSDKKIFDVSFAVFYLFIESVGDKLHNLGCQGAAPSLFIKIIKGI